MKEHKIKNLLTAYEAMLGYKPAWGKEIAGAKRIVDADYSIEDVEKCYRHYKKQAFWKDKHLSLQYIASNIGAWKQSHSPVSDLDRWFRENN